MSDHVALSVERAHCHEAEDTPASRSESVAVIAVPTAGVFEDRVTAPASSTFVSVIVTEIVASTDVSAAPLLSLPSLTPIVTEYDDFVS